MAATAGLLIDFGAERMERRGWKMLLFLLLMLLLWLWPWRFLLGGGDGAGTLAPPLNGYLCSYGTSTNNG
jgi:hypothetical protein